MLVDLEYPVCRQNPLSRTGVVRIPVCYLSIQKQESYEWEASLGYIVRP